MLDQVYLEKGQIQRFEYVENQPVPQPQIMLFSYADVLQKKEIGNMLILEKDVIQLFPINNMVSVNGEVTQPGSYKFIPGMTIDDLLFLASGVKNTAYLGRVDIIRESLGSPRKLIRVNLFNPEMLQTPLEPMDKVTVYDDKENRQTITVQGEVHAPGIYPYYEGMSLEDAVFLASNFTRNSYRDRIHVQRRFQDGTRELFNITPADYTHFILRPDDVILVHGLDVIPAKHVSIQGSPVRNPGTYPFMDGMKIKDLLFVAGGLNNKSIDSHVLVKRWHYQNDILTRESIQVRMDPLTFETTPPLILQEDDSVFLRQRSDYRIPGFATIAGEVVFPGGYEISPGDRISDLLKKSGGLSNKAFLPGVIFTRKLLKIREDATDQRLQRDIERSLLKSTVEASSSITSPETHLQALAAVRSSLNPQTQTQTQVETQEEISQEEASKKVSQKEESRIQELNLGRIVIDMEDLEKFKGGPENVELMDGDTLTIPPVINTVLVKGEVRGEASFLVRPETTAWDYLEMLGNPGSLAKVEDTYVIRPNGFVVSDLDHYTIREGDIIVVPADLSPRESTLKETATVVDIIFKSLATILTVVVLAVTL
ncbi:MAG: SLBB domain-containing protein [SAR324 cluster bacterium]|nr:SLBB domain-containing protein [SAR324 cluster bacterium]